jgi:HEAT repeat protein
MPLFGPPNVQKLIERRDLRKLARALGDDDSRIRDDAARGLIEIGDRAAVPHVIDVILSSGEEPVIAAGISILSEMTETAVPLLAERLRSGRPDERPGCGGLLGQLGEPGLEPLLETSRDPEPAMRAVGAMGLGLIDDPRAQARLVDIVNSDESFEARTYAGFAMATHKVPGAYDTLLAQLDANEPAFRAMAATNLGILGDARAGDRLGQLAEGDPDQRVRDAAHKALASLAD